MTTIHDEDADGHSLTIDVEDCGVEVYFATRSMGVAASAIRRFTAAEWRDIATRVEEALTWQEAD